MKGVGYKIATANTAPLLATLVHDLLKEGWELHGPPFVYNGNIAQALTHPTFEQE
jgi:hypothetical protein